MKIVAIASPEPVPESESPLQNPCECAEERKPRRIRARDCLSAASSSGTPAGLSTGRCPQRSGGTQTPGSPFLCLLSFGDAKESRSPAAATERHQDLAMCMLVQSKTNSGSGVFGVGAQIPPRLRLALRVLRFATQRNCDPTPKTNRLDALSSNGKRM